VPSNQPGQQHGGVLRVYARRALEDAGFSTKEATVTDMWVPVEIVLAEKV
jgi:hypothetical protein